MSSNDKTEDENWNAATNQHLVGVMYDWRFVIKTEQDDCFVSYWTETKEPSVSGCTKSIYKRNTKSAVSWGQLFVCISHCFMQSIWYKCPQPSLPISSSASYFSCILENQKNIVLIVRAINFSIKQCFETNEHKYITNLTNATLFLHFCA